MEIGTDPTLDHNLLAEKVMESLHLDTDKNSYYNCSTPHQGSQEHLLLFDHI